MKKVMRPKPNGAQEHPDPEVVPSKPRRHFTPKYRLSILKQIDECTEPGEIGTLLRREGIYSSYITRWRKQFEQGTLDALSNKKRGPKTAPDLELRKELRALRDQNRRLEERLRKAEVIIDVQKKVSTLLRIQLPENPGEKT